jgi:hypothetical protein
MSRMCPSSWIALLLVGCGFESGGVASGSASIGSAGETAGETASGGEEDEGDESPGDGDASSASTTMTSTSDPTGDPTTDPGEATTDPVDPSQGDSGSTDAGETTTDASATNATTEGEATTAVSDSGPPPDDYPDCSGPNACAELTEDCLQVVDGDNNVVGQVCVPPCLQDSDCPLPATGNAMPYCPENFGIYFCRLSCDGGLTCPDGMDCVSTNIGERCFYPA